LHRVTDSAFPTAQDDVERRTVLLGHTPYCVIPRRGATRNLDRLDELRGPVPRQTVEVPRSARNDILAPVTVTGDDALPVILSSLAPRFGATCYCRLTTSARANVEVTFRLTRGGRSVELCLDLFAQLLTPAGALAAELAQAAEAALQPHHGRARIARPRS
jgi:hypothetical protein